MRERLRGGTLRLKATVNLNSGNIGKNLGAISFAVFGEIL